MVCIIQCLINMVKYKRQPPNWFLYSVPDTVGHWSPSSSVWYQVLCSREPLQCDVERTSAVLLFSFRFKPLSGTQSHSSYLEATTAPPWKWVFRAFLAEKDSGSVDSERKTINVFTGQLNNELKLCMNVQGHLQIQIFSRPVHHCQPSSFKCRYYQENINCGHLKLWTDLFYSIIIF